MSTAGVRRAAGVAVLFAALAACTTPPAPRGTEFQGVPVTGDRRAQDAPYYLGADPAYPRGSMGGRGP